MREDMLKVMGVLLIIAGMVMIVSGAVVYSVARAPDADGITWALIGSGLGLIWSTWSHWHRRALHKE